MKLIVIEESAFRKLFDEFDTKMELAKHEVLETIPEYNQRDAKYTLDVARRRWIYAFRTLQQDLENSR